MFGPRARYPTIAAPRFANPNVSLADYRRMLAVLGIERAVLVQPHVYGSDNRCLEDALHEFSGRARGIAVIEASIADRELERMHGAGIRGVRFNLRNAGGLELKALSAIAARIRPLRWHVEFAPDPEHLPAIAQAVGKVDIPVVIPHMGRVCAARGLQSPPFQALLGLLRAGRCWIKLSGAHRMSALPYPHDDVTPFARALIETARDRLVWASDWPHTSVPPGEYMPNDGDVLDLLARWAPEPEVRQDILVRNPARFYGFSA